MNTKYHLTKMQIEDLKAGRLSKEEKLSALEHIGACEQCADFFAGSFSSVELLNLSPDFKDMVWAALERERNEFTVPNALAVKKDQVVKRADAWRKEFCLYSFKVSLAACIALLLLFSGTLDYGIGIEKAMKPDLSGVNTITENLRGFSDELIDFEVIKN